MFPHNVVDLNQLTAMSVPFFLDHLQPSSAGTIRGPTIFTVQLAAACKAIAKKCILPSLPIESGITNTLLRR